MILFDIKADLYGPPSNGREDSRPFQASLAVATVFDQIEPLHAQLIRIASFREPMQRLCDLAKVFEPFREFEMRVVDLASVLEPMHLFQDQLRQVMNHFAPLETLDQELKQFCASFGEHLSELAVSLGPAVTLQDRLAHLARAFEPARILRDEFSGLANSFALRSPASPE
jgi:hypothetical protein